MKKKQQQDLMSKNMQELHHLLEEKQKAFMMLRLDNERRKLKNTRSMFITRKEIAQVKTTMKEKEMKHESI